MNNYLFLLLRLLDGFQILLFSFHRRHFYRFIASFVCFSQKKNSLRGNWMLEQPYSLWLLKHPVLYFILLSRPQSVRPRLVASISLGSPCVNYVASYYSVDYQVLPMQLWPREPQEDCPRGCKYFNNTPLLK